MPCCLLSFSCISFNFLIQLSPSIHLIFWLGASFLKIKLYCISVTNTDGSSSVVIDWKFLELIYSQTESVAKETISQALREPDFENILGGNNVNEDTIEITIETIEIDAKNTPTQELCIENSSAYEITGKAVENIEYDIKDSETVDRLVKAGDKIEDASLGIFTITGKGDEIEKCIKTDEKTVKDSAKDDKTVKDFAKNDETVKVVKTHKKAAKDDKLVKKNTDIIDKGNKRAKDSVKDDKTVKNLVKDDSIVKNPVKGDGTVTNIVKGKKSLKNPTKDDKTDIILNKESTTEDKTLTNIPKAEKTEQKSTETVQKLIEDEDVALVVGVFVEEGGSCDAVQAKSSLAALEEMPNPSLAPGQVFEFDNEKYRDAVVMPWYRNQDQPQVSTTLKLTFLIVPARNINVFVCI